MSTPSGDGTMQSRWVLILIALIVVASAFMGLREPPVSNSGPATVIDGDSLEIGSTSIRLYGVDAPEALQTCGEGAATWNCGRAATAKLRELVGNHEVACTEMDTDSYGRSVAVCNNGSVDLGAEMAAAGLALAYRRYSDDYTDEEDRARAERRGLWSTTFTAPWDWRQDNDERATRRAPSQGGGTRPPVDAGAPPARAPGCDIKGNIRDGRFIYHVPGSEFYEETQIDVLRGERWFCSEAEAERAGWRAPRSQ